jgi:D-arabinose 1-dehydrogenase-like Zn-dependent alcohol dehydrogenase
MFQCTGFATRNANEPLAAFSFNRRDPGPKDVKIEILYCGVCHSDLHQARDEWHNTVYPCLPGHEIVGRVTTTGAEATLFKPGDLAAVGPMVDSCRTCRSCREGLEQYCELGFTPTYNGVDKVIGGPTFGGYTVAGPHEISRYLELLKRDGTLTQVGAPEKPMEVEIFSLIFKRRNFAGSLIGGIKEAQEMLDFCAEHNIIADVEVIPIQKINEAYERMLRSDVKYRFSIDMSSLPRAA